MFDSFFNFVDSIFSSSKSSSSSSSVSYSDISRNKQRFEDGVITGIIKTDGDPYYYTDIVTRKMEEDGPDYREKVEKRLREWTEEEMKKKDTPIRVCITDESSFNDAYKKINIRYIIKK